ncbi:Fe(2+) transport protein 3 [Metarhizium album ARSEF 1941]|uniref:Fe(2+) transport protein 3 n=1 Tax=Metarhizium album (strain ARSEF 1941) TaxID=1081103 RepID=A0A0B2WPC1_METAS|nr:Fe(2+) transport protein 3 [Metarhizium album ARSEF 1941]KHN94835.1 Fe(2+) transport protein 3 [Metarhizium album ARSEF 1941]
MDDAKPQCGKQGDSSQHEYDLTLHVVGLFVVLFVSCLGCGFPVAARKLRWLRIPPKIFSACKHFGTGVLIATAFVHQRQLLPTAFTSLGNPCLPDLFTKDYPPLPGAIMMGSLFVLFVIEMWLDSKAGDHSHGGPTMAGVSGHYQHDAAQARADSPRRQYNCSQTAEQRSLPVVSGEKPPTTGSHPTSLDEKSDDEQTLQNDYEYDKRGRRLSRMPTWSVASYEQHARQHTELMNTLRRPEDGEGGLNMADEEKAQDTITVSSVDRDGEPVDRTLLKRMSTNITLLEGGILFHSVFVGMTVSITVEGFVILLIAISFHQLFEGLGLGSRIAAVPYPKTSVRPWVMVLAFGTTAPIGQAIGLLARNTYDPESAFGLIIVGVFNSMYAFLGGEHPPGRMARLIGHSSSGLLIYAALVDLLAEDFLSEEANRLMRTKDKAMAFAWVLLGALGMSVVGAFAAELQKHDKLPSPLVGTACCFSTLLGTHIGPASSHTPRKLEENHPSGKRTVQEHTQTVALATAHLRVARPTDNIDALLPFYRDGLGFEVLLRFKNHDGFDGIVLGHRDAAYHLELTSVTGHEAGTAPTQDNLLVFYLPEPEPYRAAVSRMESRGFSRVATIPTGIEAERLLKMPTATELSWPTWPHLFSRLCARGSVVGPASHKLEI